MSATRRAAATAAVIIINDRGRPSHVLLSIADYQRLLADERSIMDWLSADDGVDLKTERLDLQVQAPEL